MLRSQHLYKVKKHGFRAERQLVNQQAKMIKARFASEVIDVVAYAD